MSVLPVGDSACAPLLAAATVADRLAGSVSRSATAELGGVTLCRPAADDPGGATRRRHATLDASTERLVVRPTLRRAGWYQRWLVPRLTCGVHPRDYDAPTVFGTFHMGPVRALAGFLAQLPAPTSWPSAHPELAGVVDALYDGRVQMPPTLTEGQRTAAFIHAHRTLAAEGFAVMLLDARYGNQVAASVLGADLGLATGTFALCRMSGAPLVPLALRWEGPRIRLVAGDPIPVGTAAEMAAGVGRWLESYLRAHPGDLSAYLATALGIAPRPVALSRLRSRVAALRSG